MQCLSELEKNFVYGGCDTCISRGEYCACVPSGETSYYKLGIAGAYMMVGGGAGMAFSLLLAGVIYLYKKYCYTEEGRALLS